jgi:hypothetical protein
MIFSERGGGLHDDWQASAASEKHTFFMTIEILEVCILCTGVNVHAHVHASKVTKQLFCT